MSTPQPWQLPYSDDGNFGDQLRRTLDSFGVAVVTCVEDESFCAQVLRDIFAFKADVGNVTPSRIHENRHGFPEKPRGVFFNCLSNMPALWRVRCSSRIRRIFSEALKCDVDDLIPSGDRIGLRLPVSPYGAVNGKVIRIKR